MTVIQREPLHTHVRTPFSHRTVSDTTDAFYPTSLNRCLITLEYIEEKKREKGWNNPLQIIEDVGTVTHPLVLRMLFLTPLCMAEVMYLSRDL